VDPTGQVIAQTPGDLDSLSMSADLAYLAPPSFSAEKSKMFFSLGGPKVARRTLAHGPALVAGPGSAAGQPQAGPALQGTVQRHIANVPFPAVRPWHGSGGYAGYR